MFDVVVVVEDVVVRLLAGCLDGHVVTLLLFSRSEKLSSSATRLAMTMTSYSSMCSVAVV